MAKVKVHTATTVPKEAPATFVCNICTNRRARNMAVDCMACAQAACRKCYTQYFSSADKLMCMYANCRAEWPMDFVSQSLGVTFVKKYMNRTYEQLVDQEEAKMVPKSVYKSLNTQRLSTMAVERARNIVRSADLTERETKLAQLRGVYHKKEQELRRDVFSEAVKKYNALALTYGYEPLPGHPCQLTNKAERITTTRVPGIFPETLTLDSDVARTFLARCLRDPHLAPNGSSGISSLGNVFSAWLLNTAWSTVAPSAAVKNQFERELHLHNFKEALYVTFVKKLNRCKDENEALNLYLNEPYMRALEHAYGLTRNLPSEMLTKILGSHMQSEKKNSHDG